MENNTGITILRNLLDEDARKFTSAEVHLKARLEAWVKEAGSLQLKSVLHKYIDFVQQHVKKLEGFFKEEAINYITFDNRIMQAYIDETEEKLANCTDAAIKDACLLACIQAINHFKISAYGTAAAFARALDMEKDAAIFRELEINEEHIDDRLSQLAEHEINIKAVAPLALTQ